ncbi:MAG TPA: DUF72 domain-containing protein [Verrucomicrobiae bacterium]|nr:DUF72 domain-containing protein [Verrucomicrobiae bacterium]
MKAYIGTSGWQYKHWNKRFFPADLAKEKWLNYLSTKFRSVEVNTSFYHMPKQSTFLKWKKESAPGFVFTLKLYRLFTHIKRLKIDKEDEKILTAFFENALFLGNKLGAILIQCPPSLKADHQKVEGFLKVLKNISKKLKKRFKFAIEFRHKTWFVPETYELFKKYDVAFVITNSPEWPSKIIRTAGHVYMRFHGRTKLFASNYTNKELGEWHKKLQNLKPKELFVYFNNDANAFAADNALYLSELFG